MKVERCDGTLSILGGRTEMTLICISNIGEIGKGVSAEDSLKEIEEISFKNSVNMVLLHIAPDSEDVVFITALAIDRIQAYAKKCGKSNICVCLHRPEAREFRSGCYWTRVFSVSYEEICLKGKVLADVIAISG